ncbi:sulfotransferase family protein [Portibacter marinus]|uniref:sulfotransferase family protein n=1 Tax=Portibacter marinus TaxID=2898660 RepID=UPI001F2B731A|nr:sulfotransferase [Portibacter marinus]
MNGFIGGSGSTGSSLVANVLNRHPDLFCGPETHLFTKHQLFKQWEENKHKIIEDKLKSYAWHMYSRTEVLNKNYGWTTKKLNDLIEYAHFIEEFSDEFFTSAARSYGKRYWIEKTPSNVYGFKDLTAHFPNCFLMQTIRNPYDTIASLNRRGFSIYYSTCMYMVNTCVGLAMRNYDKYIPIIYEDMVKNPDSVMNDICDRLGIKYDATMLQPTEMGFDHDIDSWGLSEHGVIAERSVGSFESASRFVQEQIIYTVNSFRLTPYYIKRYGCDIVDIPSICRLLGYQHYDDGGFMNIFQLNIDKARDHFLRIVKGYPNKLSKYPVMFRI